MLVASISADESVLLMHFLDNVFTLQYPTYRPEISEGGRGWLLALLLQTKPLYHAALALSAYHRRTILTANSGSPCPAAAIVQQETHLKKSLAYCREAMEAVNQFVQADCGSHGLGIMSSIVQLVFFEVYVFLILILVSVLTMLQSFSPAKTTCGRYIFVQQRPCTIKALKTISQPLV